MLSNALFLRSSYPPPPQSPRRHDGHRPRSRSQGAFGPFADPLRSRQRHRARGELLQMRRILLASTAIAMLAAVPAPAQQRSVKIGFVSTFSGPTAVIGNDMRNSVELALDHLGRKMGGLPVEVIYEDDQQKPEVGVQKTQKLIESDKVNFIAGYIWSNVLLASLKPAVESQTFLISANAGPSQIAGELCSPFYFSTSWQNDQTQ